MRDGESLLSVPRNSRIPVGDDYMYTMPGSIVSGTILKMGTLINTYA